jgi:hypothetical protein
MWNNYTVHMLNPGKMADRQAEARAERLAAESAGAGTGTFWLSRGIEKVTSSGVPRAALHGAAIVVVRLQHLHGPRLTPRHNRG